MPSPPAVLRRGSADAGTEGRSERVVRGLRRWHRVDGKDEPGGARRGHGKAESKRLRRLARLAQDELRAVLEGRAVDAQGPQEVRLLGPRDQRRANDANGKQPPDMTKEQRTFWRQEAELWPSHPLAKPSSQNDRTDVAHAGLAHHGIPGCVRQTGRSTPRQPRPSKPGPTRDEKFTFSGPKSEDRLALWISRSRPSTRASSS